MNMSAAQSACPSPSAAGSAADSAADSAPKLQSNQLHQIDKDVKARTWYYTFRVPITVKIAAISKYDEWNHFWKTGLDSQFRTQNLTTADIICISSQKIALNKMNLVSILSNDESNHAMNEWDISDDGSYLICDGFIRRQQMRFSTVQKWLSPEHTRLDIRDLHLTPISVPGFPYILDPTARTSHASM